MWIIAQIDKYLGISIVGYIEMGTGGSSSSIGKYSMMIRFIDAQIAVRVHLVHTVDTKLNNKIRPIKRRAIVEIGCHKFRNVLDCFWSWREKNFERGKISFGFLGNK